ncbi:MAG: lipoprotein-releasing ABC transporter permease subunit [Halieaceae bacterium]|nr:lipoprotein-releasing ABC transporter permease subunit [Halieaceae bacterium]
MTWSEILRVSLRYTFAFGRGHLSTFLSSLSMLGLVLAIALLITVLSVMNGFDKEMRERILSLVPHITIYSQLPMSQWQEQLSLVSGHPGVTAVTPFTQFDALLMRGNNIETTKGIGLDIDRENVSGQLVTSLQYAALQDFSGESRGLILGAAMADKLKVERGDKLTLIVPSGGAAVASHASRFETVTVSAILNTGTELDQTAAIVHLELASRLAGLDHAVSGLRVSTADIFQATRIGWELVRKLPRGYYVTNWMMTHGNLYAAIQLSRDLITFLLFSIIAVAAFNVVSSLVLVVLDKQGDIAILRTLGTSPSNIAWIFVLQGAMIGLVGVILGSAVGISLSLAVPGVVAWLEHLLDIRFLNTDVYPVSFLPVDLLPGDILVVGSVAFVMCVLAAIYPALRAARMAPAAILHRV